MKRIHLLASAAVMLLAAACGGGGSHGTSGTAFVKTLITNTSDTDEPRDVDGLDLQFSESTAVFDELFQ